MKLIKIRNSGLLILTAFIWGSAFVAQSEGGDLVGPYTFNSIRSFIGALALLPVIFFLDKIKMSKKPEDKEEKKLLLLGGLACGIILGLASTLQQLGIYYGTSSGKAGFLTACYILIVPILGIFLKKKCGWNIWAGNGRVEFAVFYEGRMDSHSVCRRSVLRRGLYLADNRTKGHEFHDCQLAYESGIGVCRAGRLGDFG